MTDFLLFSGTSNIPLAKRISHRLGKDLSDIEITRFIDNECRVWIKKNDLKGKHVIVIQSLSPVADQHLVELCLIGKALKSLQPAHVTAVIPWLGYSKQDREFRRGEAVSAHLVAQFLEVAGFDQIITVTLHSERLIPFFRIPVMELSTYTLFATTLSGLDSPIVASPDKGGQFRSDQFAGHYSLPVVHLSKRRDVASGTIDITGIDGSVKGKTVILFDDIISTGQTAIKSAQFLKKEGAGSIHLLATHAILAGDAGTKLEKSPIDRVVVTDTVDIRGQKQFKKLETLSVAPLIAEAIRKLIQ